MPEYRLASGVYLAPTPAGAYYACTSPDRELARMLLLRLMGLEQTPLLTPDLLHRWMGREDEQTVLEQLFRMQSLLWIQGETESQPAPQGALEELLPDLLSSLSSTDKALLADDTGLCLASHGYAHETAEELSALCGDLASLCGRHQRLLHNNLGIRSEAWGIVDAAGDSQIGFWPLYVGNERFVLVISGMPRLNQPAFTHLVWALVKRYAEPPA